MTSQVQAAVLAAVTEAAEMVLRQLDQCAALQEGSAPAGPDEEPREQPAAAGGGGAG